MKKRQLLKFLLVGCIIITSAISISSCKKSNEASEDLNSLPVVETPIFGDRVGDFAYVCPYCQDTNHLIEPDSPIHWHLFEPGGMPPTSLPMEYDSMYPFPVNYCEVAWNLPNGGHVCRYAVEGMRHGHALHFHYYENGYDGYTANSWHVGGATPYWP